MKLSRTQQGHTTQYTFVNISPYGYLPLSLVGGFEMKTNQVLLAPLNTAYAKLFILIYILDCCWKCFYFPVQKVISPVTNYVWIYLSRLGFQSSVVFGFVSQQPNKVSNQGCRLIAGETMNCCWLHCSSSHTVRFFKLLGRKYIIRRADGQVRKISCSRHSLCLLVCWIAVFVCCSSVCDVKGQNQCVMFLWFLFCLA